MNYWDNLAVIIENATLNIFQFDVHQRNSMDFRNRILPFYVVSYIKEGTCRLRYKNMDYYAGPGDVVFIPPNVIHDHVKDNNDLTTFMWWHFTFKIAGLIDVLSIFDFPVCFKLTDTQRFEKIFNQYVSCVTSPKSISDILLKEAKAFELISIILEAAISYNEVSLDNNFSNVFTRILADIIQHPEKQGFLKELGDKYHMHPTYISNQFKKLYNISPIQLQKELRIGKAKKLMMTENMPISQIAEILGYEDIDDFTRFFKSREGVSPLKFKKRIENNESGTPLNSIEGILKGE